VLDIVQKNIFFGFSESFILFTKFAIFNCDLVFFFRVCASWFFGAQFGFFLIFLSSLSFPFVNLIPYKCYFFLRTIYITENLNCINPIFIIS
jgi:hypothetical protein